MTDMTDLMLNKWGTDKPNLLISVIGDADNVQMSKRLKDTFRQGLMKTALTTGAWITTAGTHEGVMKHVGKAVKDFGIASSTQKPVVTIGIAPWGCVHNRDALKNSEEKLVSKGNKSSSLRPAEYRIGQETNTNESFLDPNHSHFILVDTEDDSDVIQFRVDLEKEIAKIQIDKDDVPVPTVLLVLGGGIDTLETVYKAIQNNKPAVIVKGSGRVADILAYAYQNSKENEILAGNQERSSEKRTGTGMDVALENKLIREFGSSKIDQHMTLINNCLGANDLLSVFELDNTSGSRELDVFMLQTSLKANVMDHQLRLALAWNRIDVAKSDIFTDDKCWPTGYLNELMLSAIQLNRTDFVELFMDHGVSLQELITKDSLSELYKKIPQNNCLLRTLLDNPSDDISLKDIGILIGKYTGDYFENSCIVEVDDNAGGIRGFEKQQATKHLFMYSVLMIRQDMAKIFWAEGKDAIAGALVANGLLKEMKEKTKDAELAITIQKHIDEWSNLAIGVLNKCHSKDEKKAQKLLLTMCTLLPPLALWLIEYRSPLSENVKVPPDTSVRKKKTSNIKYEPVVNSSTSVHPGIDVYTACNKVSFFFEAPLIAFIYNIMSYVVFLGLFAYTLLFDFNTNMSKIEIVLIIWVFTFCLEELRQFYFCHQHDYVTMSFSNSLKSRSHSYIKDLWNVLDLITIGLFIIGIILRSIQNPNTFELARLVLALNFSSFCLRLLHLCKAHEELGPKIFMIWTMIRDLKYFVSILMVFVMSYAISSYSIMFSNSPFNWKTIKDMMGRAYWNIYGELFLDENEGEGECTFDEALWVNRTHPRCQNDFGKDVGTIFMGCYLLLAHVLLLNLLIAMFSVTFQKIQDNTYAHWCYQRFFLIYEYYTRPVAPPPLIVLAHIYLLVERLLKFYNCTVYNSGKDEFCRNFENEAESLEQWENEIADAYLQHNELNDIQSTEYKLSNAADRMQTLDTLLTSLTQQNEWIIKALQANNEVPSSAPPAIPNLDEERNK